MVALQRSTDARIGQGRELDRTLACVRGGGEELRIRFSRMAHELGHAVFEASDDGKEIRDLDVAGVLELADEVIGGAHALGTVLVALAKRMRPGRSNFGAWRVGHERGARDDSLAVGANDAAVDTRGSTEVVRVHDQPLHELRGSVAPRPGPPPAPEDPPAGVASMTARTSHPDDSRRRRASSSSTPVSSRTMRIARSRNLLLAG